MTIVQHGFMSGLISYIISRNWIIVSISILLGIFPDISRFFQNDINDWNQFYEKTHNFKKNWWLLLIPFWNIHIVLDYYTHDNISGGWLWFAKYVELFLWVVEFLIIYRFLC